MIDYKKAQKYKTFQDFWDPQKNNFITENGNDQIWFDALVQRFEQIKDLFEAGEN